MPDLIIEPAQLAKQLDNNNLLIVDLCQEKNWLQHHLPSAVHVHPAELVSGAKPATGQLPDKQRLEALFSRIGYESGKHIVAYDDEGGGWAGRFIWTLDVIGHARSSLLNGGLIAWANEGFPVTAEIIEPAPTKANITLSDAVVAEKEDLLAAIGRDDTIIWDARAPEEWAGAKVAAARGGHIPGAINLDWLEVMDRNNNLKLRKDLPELLEARGIQPGTAIITHCQTHHRSGLTYVVGKLLGYDIKGYHGSWAEWGNDPDTPIDNPADNSVDSPRL